LEINKETMKFTFDLFNGDESPSKDFVGWLPKWWYRSKGLPIEKGFLPSGEEWLLVGWNSRCRNISLQ